MTTEDFYEGLPNPYPDSEPAHSDDYRPPDEAPPDLDPSSNGKHEPIAASAEVDYQTQFDYDVAGAVRRLKIADAARALYNAERSDSTRPHREDVAAVVRGEVDPLLPTMLTRSDRVSLIYPGLLHWLYGPPGLGKSWVAIYACAQLLDAGGTVGYLDWEGNRYTVGDRLRCVGTPAEAVEARYDYYRPGNLENQRDWLAEIARPWHLCIFDGVAKALAASGRDEERNPDVLAWMDAVITPVTEAGCAVLMLDHVTKDVDSRAMARGAGAKQGEISGAAWEMRAGKPYNRRTAGFVRLIQRKDREGRTGIDGDCVAELHVTPRGDRTRLELSPPSMTAADQARAVAMERVWKAVEAITATGERASNNKVRDIVGGDKAHVAALLAELNDLGHLRRDSGGSGRGNAWTAVSPYRAPAVEPAPSPLVAVGSHEPPERTYDEGEF